jgi:DNA-binding transcriptional MocR family regulator
MARPKGQFQTNKEKLYAKLVGLTNPRCWASNRFLAEAIGVSVRQVQRYLHQLVKEGRILHEQKHYLKGGWKTKRFITLIKQAVMARVFGKPKYEKTQSIVVDGKVYDMPIEDGSDKRSAEIRALLERERQSDREEDERMKDPAYASAKRERINRKLALTARLADDPEFAAQYRANVLLNQSLTFGEK